ncbi:UNVERIFIED_CONTAM: hypothetical protein PYX00_003411 [Menopon gallinae]|uniref:Transcription initiation factor IIA subunit 2 n=1 Tax=Menopon gallinae TaxID=328185 RepID=A0AAW2I1I6_9NEOP
MLAILAAQCLRNTFVILWFNIYLTTGLLAASVWNTTLGTTLQESLDELIQYGQITPQLGMKVLLQFDKSINNALSTRVKSRLTFKAGKLNTYRFCDNVWTFFLTDVEFREVQEIAKVDKVKVVACDGRNVAEEASKR